MLGKVASAIGKEAGGTIGAVDLVQVEGSHTIRDITVATGDASDWPVPTERRQRGHGRARARHDRPDVPDPPRRQDRAQQQGSRCKTHDDLSMASTPGVARVCNAIYEDPDKAFQYTIKRNCVAVVTDGTAVLGLGDIGPAAAMPVMEGKAMLFKEFGGVDAFPICLDTRDPDEIVAVVRAIAPGFGGINLEDISAPRCFEIEDRLKAELDIQVFHDDQHGTADRRARGAAQRTYPDRPADRGHPDRDPRARRRRDRGREDPARGGRDAHHRLRLARRRCTIEREDYVDGTMHAVKRWIAQATNPRPPVRRPGRRARRRRPVHRAERRRADAGVRARSA